jgi:flagellar motor switch protein FliN/FliY
MGGETDRMEAFETTASDENSAKPELIDTQPVSDGEPTAEFLQGPPRGGEKGSKEKSYSFSDLEKKGDTTSQGNIGFILDIPLEITVELGRTKMLISEMLKLGQGSVIEVSRLAGESLDVLANQRLIARGEVVVIDEKYGIRLTEIVSPTERIESLK